MQFRANHMISGVVVAVCLTTSPMILGCSRSSDGGSAEPMLVTGSLDSSEINQQKGDSIAQDIIDRKSIYETSRFSEGVAWVNVRSGGWTLINKEGEIQFLLNDLPEKYGFIGASHYVNDACIAFGGTGSYFNSQAPAGLLDKNGEIIWALRREGEKKAAEVYGADAVEDVAIMDISSDLWHGYLIVCFHVDAYEYTGTLYGVIDAEGNWVVEPPTIDEALAGAEAGIDPGSHGWESYDPYTETFLRVNRQCLILYRTGEILPCTGFSDDGVIEYGGLNIKEIEDQEYLLSHHNLEYDINGRFVDGDGNPAFNLNETLPASTDSFELDQYDAFKNSEYELVHLENEGGGEYFTVINTQGKPMFEPKHSGEERPISENLFFHIDEDTKLGYYIDAVTGERLGSLEFEEGCQFHDGLAWVLNNDEWNLLDAKGDLVFPIDCASEEG